MRTIDTTAIEAPIREALPLATDDEVGAILQRLDGRGSRPRARSIACAASSRTP